MAAPNLEAAVYETIATELYEAYREANPIDPLRKRFDLSIADGYEIQRRVTQRRLEADDEGDLAGYKIGFTSDAVREDLMVEQPASGRLLGGTVSIDSTDATDQVGAPGAVVDSGEFVAPRVEPEVAVELGERVTGPLDAREAAAAVSAVLPAIEVVDSRIRDWDFTPAEAIADNTLAAALYAGERYHAEDDAMGVDLADEEVTVETDGTAVASASGAAVLGGPLRALSWLTEALATRGNALEAGDIVSTGSITRPIPIEAGTEVVARFGSLGTVALRVE